MTTDTQPRNRNGSGSDTGDRRSLKVKIPAEYHTKLHSIKVLKGKTISSAITEALCQYLEEIDVDESSDPAPDPA